MYSISALFLVLPLLARASSLIQRQTSKTVEVTYEDYPITAGISGISRVQFPTGPYKDLAYSFLFFENLALTTIGIARPEGKKGIVGVSGSTISIPPGSKVKSIKPKSISLVTFVAGGTSVNAPIPGTVDITAKKADGTPYTDVVSCTYMFIAGNDPLGVGEVKPCTLPDSWDEVFSMSFALSGTLAQPATDTLDTLKKQFGVTNVVGGGAGAAGGTAFIGDNFVYYEKCVAGDPDPSDGRCK